MLQCVELLTSDLRKRQWLLSRVHLFLNISDDVVTLSHVQSLDSRCYILDTVDLSLLLTTHSSREGIACICPQVEKDKWRPNHKGTSATSPHLTPSPSISRPLCRVGGLWSILLHSDGYWTPSRPFPNPFTPSRTMKEGNLSVKSFLFGKSYLWSS